ncbi:clavesin-1-like [Sycon ciliatum]|uniref:clavesin-1-like n=1 Tax=Sycon ciliatum TaxID=27933 RepID=UPI0031F61222
MDSMFARPGLSPTVAEKARVELNETDQSRMTALQELRERLPERMAKKTDVELKKFLRVAKLDVGKAHSRLVAYDKFRKEHSDMFENLTAEEILPVLEAGVLLVLKERDTEGRRIFIFNYSRWDTSKISLPDIQRAFLFLMEVLSLDEETQVGGMYFLQNLADYSFTHSYQFTPALLRRALVGVQTFPVRLGGGTFVNEPFYYSVLWKLCKPFMSEKLRDRTHFCGSNVAAIHEHVNPDALPEYFGGKANEEDIIQTLVEFVRSCPPLAAW